MKIVLIALSFVMLNLNSTWAQWVNISAIPQDDIIALAVSADTIYAASGTNLVYKSIDGGINWNAIMITSNPINLVSITVIDNIIYAGTSNQGIYSSIDYGITWQAAGNIVFPVTAIGKNGNALYASTLGDGVYVYNNLAGSWIPFNNSLPSYSVNVNTLVSTSTSLIICAGSNGTFYRYNFLLNGWNEEFYHGGLSPGLQIQDIINISDTLFVVNWNQILRSNDSGVTWVNDKLNSHNGTSRTIYQGANKLFTLTNTLTGGTWIQERNKTAGTGVSWSTNEEFVPNSFSYDMLEFQGKEFLAKSDGLFVKVLNTGLQIPEENKCFINIYPIPAGDSQITITSELTVNEFTIVSLSGQVIYSEFASKSEFTIQPHLPAGSYVMKLCLSDNSIAYKVLII